MTLSGYDAAFPPAHPPAGDQVVMGYIGGNTPHVWTLADWNSQSARYRIPIWTRSNPAGHSGTTEGNAALAALNALGAPHGILVVLDYETAQDGAYAASFDAVMRSVGNTLALYGSTSTLFANPKPSGGYFPAQLTGTPHLYPGTLLTQYAFESAWDDDTVSAAAVLWDARPPAPPMERHMATIIKINGNPDVYLLDGLFLHHIVDPASEVSYQASIPVATVTAAEFAALQADVAASRAQLSLTDAQAALIGAAIGAHITMPTHITGTETTTVAETLG